MKELKTAICFFITVLIGCSSNIDKESITGKYTANHRKGSDIIEIKSDGYYIYCFKSSEGREILNKGKWNSENKDGKLVLTFEGFIFGIPGYGVGSPGFWVVEAKKSFLGKIRLDIDPDLGYFYQKEI